MKWLFNKIQFGSFISHIAFCICFVLYSGCGSGTDTSEGTPSNTGSIAFNLNIQAVKSLSEIHQSAIDCAASGIATIDASVYNQSDVLLKSGGPWNCDAHQGTITGVQAGTNYSVVVLGRDAVGDPLYEGRSSGIDVIAGQTNNIGEITLSGVTLFWDNNDTKWDKAVWAE